MSKSMISLALALVVCNACESDDNSIHFEKYVYTNSSSGDIKAKVIMDCVLVSPDTLYYTDELRCEGDKSYYELEIKQGESYVEVGKYPNSSSWLTYMYGRNIVFEVADTMVVVLSDMKITDRSIMQSGPGLKNVANAYGNDIHGVVNADTIVYHFDLSDDFLDYAWEFADDEYGVHPQIMKIVPRNEIQ